MENIIEKLVPQLRFGEFAGEWENIVLNEKSTFFKGKGISKAHIVEGGKTKCIRYGELYTTYNEVIKNVYSSTNLPKEDLVFSEANDVIIPSSGETLLDIATASCVSDANIALGGDLNIIRTSINGIFLAYYLNDKKKKAIARIAQGSSVIHLYNSQLKKLKLNIPTKTEQQKIASFLSAIDKKIQQVSRKKALLEEYKKGVMQQLFSGELRFKDENGEEFGDWEIKKLKELTKINQGLQINISERYLKKVENSYFYITNEFLRKNSEKEFYILNPPENVICDVDDVLMTRTGNTGKVVTGVKGAFHNNFFKIKFDKNSLDKDFLVFFLRLYTTQCMIMRLAGTSTIPDLNHGDFYRIQITLPCFEEQQKIANYLSSLDKKIENLNTQITKAKTFKKGLLQQLFV